MNDDFSQLAAAFEERARLRDYVELLRQRNVVGLSAIERVEHDVRYARAVTRLNWADQTYERMVRERASSYNDPGAPPARPSPRVPLRQHPDGQQEWGTV